MLPPSSTLARLGRWALLAAPLFIGAALFVTVWSTYRSVSTASDLLVRGQADLLHDAVRSELGRGRPAPPTADELAAVVDGLDGEGLVYLAWVDADGHVVADAGKASEEREAIERAARRTLNDDPVDIGGGRVRCVFRGPRNRRGRGDATPTRALVVEMEPRQARALAGQARGTLAVGAVAAAAFLVVALVLVRWLLQREKVARRQEHDRRLASLGQMSATLAHEIRNPLASLKGNAQLLARSLPETDKARGKADRVVGEAVRLESLINDLLEFARAGELRRADADPAAFLREVAADHPRVTVAAAAAPARWPFDVDRMRQVVGNLVDNALKAGDGPVELGATNSGGRLTLTVRDHGPGIDPDDLDHIFEPFFTRRTQGTGLGLAVARRIVELHGGTITAENDPAGGARFTVQIPR